MASHRRKTLAAAACALALCAPASAVEKLDARLRARRGASGGYAPAAAGGAASGRVHRVLLRLAPGAAESALAAAHPGARFGARAGRAVAAFVPDAQLDALAADPRVEAVEPSLRARPTLDAVRSSATNAGLSLGAIYGTAATDLANATGAGVVIGIVDTGIDWQHLDFVNDGPNTSRILAIWDQTISSHAGGAFPTGYSYGAEYSNASITTKLQGGVNTINTKDADGHGTHVASIAAGDGTSTNGAIPSGTFRGLAPSADIVAVRTTFDTADVVDALNYIVAKAAAAGKRAVINLSLGSTFGPHDGSSAFELGVGAVAASTPVVVAMGNEGNDSPHARATVPSGGAAGFSASVSGSPAEADIEFWHPPGDGYSASVSLSGIGGSVTAAAGATASGALGGHTVEVDNGTTVSSNGHKLIYVRVTRGGGITTTSISAALTRTANGGSGRVDGYLDPQQGLDFTSNVDATGTLGEPASSSGVFSVGAYVSKREWPSIEPATRWYTTQNALGELSHFSSRGPTRDGRQAPEVAAPGDAIAAAMSSDPAAYPGAAFVLPDNRHRIERGTSMAAPVVAGILAARIQWGPNRTVAELREILRAQARSDAAVTNAGTIPNDRFGYGKVSASPQPLSSPTGLSVAVLGPSSMTFTWGAALGADAYSLYYATNPTVRFAAGAQSPYTLTGLPANTTSGAVVKGSAAGVDGASSFVSTATYAAPPAALPTVAAHTSSATVSFASCPAAPAASSCGGYQVVASTAASFSGAQTGSTTLDRAATQLVVTGLQPLTTYWFRLSTLNGFGAPTATGAVSATTLTDLLAPANPQFSLVSSGSVRFDWSEPGNPPGTLYYAQASTVPSFGSGAILTAATTALFTQFTGMSPNSTYYYRVQAASGPYLAAGPLATLAAVPAAPALPFTAASQSGLSLSWGANGNPAGTLYRAELSADAGFAEVAASSETRNAFADLSGLSPNTLYHARVRAVSHAGTATAYQALGSSPTLVQLPAASGAPFSSVTTGGFAYSFGPGGNPAGTLFLVRVSTDAGFATLTASSVTASSTAYFSGLDSNRLYHAAVAALNLAGSPTAFVGAASTATFTAAPAVSTAPIGTKTVSSLTLSWTKGALAPGTQFLAQASLSPGFAAIAASSTTLNASAVLSGLAAHASYYLRVAALSSHPPNPDGPWLSLGPAWTLASPPTAVASPFPLVGVASATLAWTPPAAASALRAELSLNASFDPVAASSVVAAGASAATLSGLAYGTRYYARVGALNGDGDANYLSLGSTVTAMPVLSSAPVGSGSATLPITGAFPAAPAVRVEIEGGTFSPGTVVTVLGGVTQDLSQARSLSGQLTPLAAGVGIDISAQGQQPMRPVRLVMTYDPALIPAGKDARTLVVARYDEASGQWAPVPSGVDTRARTVTASLSHFSSYAPFFTTAGAAVDAARIYPVPWEIGDPTGPYGASALTMTSLPAGAKVRVLTLLGELVWEGEAGAGGTLSWDGRNSNGRPAASGTYYISIQSGGSRALRRAVIVR